MAENGVNKLKLEKSRVEELVSEKVLEFTVSAGCADGDGMAGILRSIRVKTASGKELHLVLKSIDESATLAAKFAQENGTFKTENLVYSTLVPKLENFAKSRGLEAEIPVPRVYSAYKGSNTMDDYICMEDLRPEGYRMTDKYVGLNLEEMLMVMDELAKFHATSYALIKWEGEKIFEGDLALLTQNFSVDTFSDEMNPKIADFSLHIQASMGLALDLLKTRNVALHKKLESHMEKTASAATDPRLQFQTGFGTDHKYFPVIMHGDAWQNNFLFKYTSEGKPISVRFLDFQFTRRGNIYEDLMYTVYTSTTPEFRRHNLLPILGKYFSSFSLRLQELRTHQPIGFTLGNFVDTFMANRACVYRYMTFAIPLQLGTSIPEVLAMMAKLSPDGMPPPPPEPTTPEEQAETMVQMMRMQMKTSERAIGRLVALTQEMVDLNVF